jgi:hypothetical protein
LPPWLEVELEVELEPPQPAAMIAIATSEAVSALRMASS